MQQRHIALMLSATIVALTGHHSQAQTAATNAATATTRAQVKMERDEFLKSHRWDSMSENWVLKQDFEPPAPLKTRVEVLKERDEFLKRNRWDSATGEWINLPQPRTLSNLTREQVRRETREFLRTHEWDEVAEAWISKRKAR
jgi:hypothetical protein